MVKGLEEVSSLEEKSTEVENFRLFEDISIIELEGQGFQEVVAAHRQLDLYFQPAVGGASEATDVGPSAARYHAPVFPVMRAVKGHHCRLTLENTPKI